MSFRDLGKLSEIHIESLVDGIDKARKARRATSPRLTSRPHHHFHWRKKSAK